MHRILENVLTYYFENILNIQERQLVTDQLRVIDKSVNILNFNDVIYRILKVATLAKLIS